MSKSKAKNNKNNKSSIDGVQILNNEVKDAHPIESATLANGLFGVDIKDSLIDPDTKFYI